MKLILLLGAVLCLFLVPLASATIWNYTDSGPYYYGPGNAMTGYALQQAASFTSNFTPDRDYYNMNSFVSYFGTNGRCNFEFNLTRGSTLISRNFSRYDATTARDWKTFSMDTTFNLSAGYNYTFTMTRLNTTCNLQLARLGGTTAVLWTFGKNATGSETYNPGAASMHTGTYHPLTRGYFINSSNDVFGRAYSESIISGGSNGYIYSGNDIGEAINMSESIYNITKVYAYITTTTATCTLNVKITENSAFAGPYLAIGEGKFNFAVPSLVNFTLNQSVDMIVGKKYYIMLYDMNGTCNALNNYGISRIISYNQYGTFESDRAYLIYSGGNMTTSDLQMLLEFDNQTTTPPPSDTCTAPAINNNWIVNWRDNCTVTLNTNLGYGNLTLNNTNEQGTFTIRANLTIYNLALMTTAGARFIIDSNGGRLIRLRP